MRGDGSNLPHFPIFNYNEGNLDCVGAMLRHPRALLGLGDAGADVGTICDAIAALRSASLDVSIAFAV